MTQRFARLIAGLGMLAHGFVLAADPVTRLNDLGALVAPFTLSLGNSFNDLNAGLSGIQIAPSGTAITLQASDQFVDYYRFGSNPVMLTSILGTIDLNASLNINDLEVRLFQDLGWNLGPLGAAAPLTGLPALATAAGNGETQVLDNLTLPGGAYVLEVRGRVVGSAGGSYSGVMNLSPVPEAGLLWMSLAGLGVLVAQRRLRRHV